MKNSRGKNLKPGTEDKYELAAAKAWLKNNRMRISICWRCTADHKHLKLADFVFFCPRCGKYFYKNTCIGGIQDGQGGAELEKIRKVES